MRQMAQRTKQKTRKKKAPARPRPTGKPADKTSGARINQLFLDALRDLEDLKNLARRPGHGRA
jgi:hypothetical protein